MQEDYGQLLKEIKFEQGASKLALFFHADKGIAGEVHGDDFGFIMPENWEKWFNEVLSKNDFKVTGRFSSVFEEKQSERYQRYLELDARYVEQLIEELELEGGETKPVITPAVKRSNAEIIGSERSSPVLEADHRTKYYSLVKRAKKEPNHSHCELLKMVGRYWKIAQFEEMVSIIQVVGRGLDGAAPKALSGRIDVWGDSDQAGDPRKRCGTGSASRWFRCPANQHERSVQEGDGLPGGGQPERAGDREQRPVPEGEGARVASCSGLCELASQADVRCGGGMRL